MYSLFNRVACNPRGGSRAVAGRGSRAATPASEDEFSSPEPRRRNRRSASPVAARSRRRRSPSVEEIRPRARRAPPSLGPRSSDGYDRLGRIVDVLARQSAAERVLGPGANGPRSFWDDVSDLYWYAFFLQDLVSCADVMPQRVFRALIFLVVVFVPRYGGSTVFLVRPNELFLFYLQISL